MSTCDHCQTNSVQLECSKCGHFKFCSYECSDALALEHAQLCYDAKSTNKKYLEKHLIRANIMVDSHMIDHVEAHALLGKNMARQKKKMRAPKKVKTRGRRIKSKSPRRRRNKSKSPRKQRSRSRSRSLSPEQQSSSPTLFQRAKERGRQVVDSGRQKISRFRNAVQQQRASRSSSPPPPPIPVVYRGTTGPPQVVVIPQLPQTQTIVVRDSKQMSDSSSDSDRDSSSNSNI